MRNMAKKVGEMRDRSVSSENPAAHLAVVGDSEGGGEEGVTRVDADLHGVLGVDELQQHVQELSFVGRRRHYVPEISIQIKFKPLIHSIFKFSVLK